MDKVFRAMNIDSLNYGLSVLSRKNDVISKNIANNDTPMYKAQKLEFGEAMEEYFSDGKKIPLKVTSQKHIQPISTPAAPESFSRFQNNPSTRNDGNDVNVDYEMSELASSSIMFNMMSQMTSTEFTRLKSSITGR